MPEDRFDAAHRQPQPLHIADALRALPQERPAESAWPALSAALGEQSRRRDARRRTLPWLALAAVLALAALALPRLLAPPVDVVDPAPIAAHTVAPDEAAALQALITESAQLEALLAVTQDHAVADGAALLLHARLQQRLQMVDLLLADSTAATSDPSAQLPLWQERVLLMRRLAGLGSADQLLAARGDSGDSPIVLAL